MKGEGRKRRLETCFDMNCSLDFASIFSFVSLCVLSVSFSLSISKILFHPFVFECLSLCVAAYHRHHPNSTSTYRYAVSSRINFNESLAEFPLKYYKNDEWVREKARKRRNSERDFVQSFLPLLFIEFSYF